MPSQTLVAVLFLGCVAFSAADRILIKGGTVVNAESSLVADVLVEGGLIKAVGTNLKVPEGSARVIEAHGKYVMPGGIDPHTHLDAQSQGTTAVDDYFDGTCAALAGGTTMIIDHAAPVDDDLMQGFEAYKAKAKVSTMDYAWHMTVTKWNDKVAADMKTLTEEGINSFKFFMAYKGAVAVTDDQLLEGLQHCKNLGALPLVHAEGADAVEFGRNKIFNAGITGPEGHYMSRPAALEDEATYRALKYAEFVNVPIWIVHVMSATSIEEITRARTRGQRAICEVIASAIAFDESVVFNPDWAEAAKFVMSPPIRSRAHQLGIKRAIAGGHVGAIATDHAAYNSTMKAKGRHDFRLIPNGMHGIEERMHVAWHELVNEGWITPSEYVSLTSTFTARAFNVYPKKGAIAAGSDADIIILDPTVEHTMSAKTHHSKMDFSVYEGRTFKGKVISTISQGVVVWDNDKLNVTKGAGRYIKLPTHGLLFEGLDTQDALHGAINFPYGKLPIQRAGDQVNKVTKGREEL